jgi:cytochrome c-type biogenesis protein CcmF
MIPTLGHGALAAALALALLQSFLGLAGAAAGRERWMGWARHLTGAQTLLVLAAFGALATCFVQHDFSVYYVAAHSNTHLPLAYRLAAVWGGHEGSLLLWVLMLVGWMQAVAWRSRGLPAEFVARVLAVMSLVNAGFLLFMLATSNPFARLLPPVREGRDLNPLLQDPGMVFHPPMLYMGYVGFSVAFAFALAALIGGKLDAAWARWTRPWTMAAWAFLTLGIALGSFWAYYELGWGGWWFWDPVENASFMPWLAGTALVHSLAVSEKRGAFKAWTLLLALMAFSLSLLGTFLVRSGVLSSVHSFASDPKRGLFILVFLALVIGGSLALYAARAGAIGLGQRFGTVSRESALLLNNLLLVVATGSVLLGTLYPLFLDALGLGKVSVGPPYFDSVFRWLMAPLLVLLGAGPLVRWKDDAWGTLARRLRGTVLATLLVVAAAWSLGATASPWSCAGYALAGWVVGGVLVDLWAWRANWRQLSRSQLGMWTAHVGVAAFVLGVTTVQTHESSRDLRMQAGDTVALAGYDFRFVDVAAVAGPNYAAARGRVEVTRAGEPVATLWPEKRIYRVQRNPMTEAAIDSGAARDLYVSLGELLPDGSWTVRVQHKPMVIWIWLGCVVMALGGALAATDRRYRQRGTTA